VTGAQAVYYRCVTSMASKPRGKCEGTVFQRYQVNTELMSLAASDALFMHCLPAHRGLEVTPEILDAPVVVSRSIRKPHVRAESHPAYSVLAV